MTARFTFLDHPGPLAFAHRGGAFGGLENSLSAFGHAVDLGFRYLETDVRATADGVLLAFHDSTLDRITDRAGRISELPYADVRKARIGGREPIPLLGDLLASWPHVRVNVDVKEAAAVRPLLRVLDRTRAHDRVCVASFSGRRLGTVRAAAGPMLCTSVSPGEALSLWLASRHATLRCLAGGDIPCAQVPPYVGRVPFVTPAFVRTAHQVGVQVHVWTVNEPREMHRLLDMGVDGLITDRLEALRDVLVRREQWAG